MVIFHSYVSLPEGKLKATWIQLPLRLRTNPVHLDTSTSIIPLDLWFAENRCVDQPKPISDVVPVYIIPWQLCILYIYIYTYIYSNIFKYSQIWEQLSCSDHIAAGQLWSNTIKTYKNYSGCSACPWRPWRRQACAPLQPIPRAGWPSWKAWTSKWKGSDQRKHVLYHDVLDVWIIIVQNIYTVIILPISKTNDNRYNYDILIYSWCTMICHAVLEQESWPFVR